MTRIGIVTQVSLFLLLPPQLQRCMAQRLELRNVTETGDSK